MKALDLALVEQYVTDHIGTFHARRLAGLERLKLKTILKRKNPYMFRAKNIETAAMLVQGILDAHISSSDEGIFGEWLEGLAIYVNQLTFDGRKSATPGVDLEFDHEGVRHLVSIKSGPNWGNSAQINKMIDSFNSARRVVNTSGGNTHVKAVNGCCYGKLKRANEYREKGDYYKLCGQSFWTFISGDSALYLKLIEPLSERAAESNAEFDAAYAKLIDRFSLEFITEFCDLDTGAINWQKLIRLNSGVDS